MLDAGDLASDPINTEDIWVSFDFSGRDLSGNIILTRNADDAVLAGEPTAVPAIATPTHRGDVSTAEARRQESQP